MKTLSCILYATLGVLVAELLLQGAALIVNANASVQRNFAISLGVFFIVSAAFLEPLAERLKIAAELTREGRRQGLFWGFAGLFIAFIFLLVDAAIEHAINHNLQGTIFLFAALLPVTGLTTLGWIVGAQRGKRAGIYGALLGFLTDFAARMALWLTTGSILANPDLPPDALSTALIAGGAGGVQAAFYALCGGLALDLSRSSHVARNLAIALVFGILTWAIAYGFVGSHFGLPNASIYAQTSASFVRIVDYAGWVLGLALCPWFPRAPESQNRKLER